MAPASPRPRSSTAEVAAMDGSGARSSMVVVDGIDALEPTMGRLFAVVGVFDGLHLGHGYLLGELRRVAAEHHARPTVITFDHHPDEILKGAAPPLLCDPEERLERLATAGVEVTVIETFDRALRETPYDAWVGRIADRVDLAGFLMTPESAFGYERRGTPDTVAELGRTLGYEVVVVPQFTLDGEPIKSSDIRAAIAAGDLARAARMLGRRVAVVGNVERTPRDTTPLTFAMPVALPPGGVYEAFVRTAGGSVRNRQALIDETGVRLEPAVPATTGARLAVELVQILRDRPSTATIRRS
ncbi:MAG: FAD synthetase family protein [Chloroflexi bacterium]|nr:MAG: FAD synthetase family protein [Chloroflexota bacterium]